MVASLLLFCNGQTQWRKSGVSILRFYTFSVSRRTFPFLCRPYTVLNGNIRSDRRLNP